MDRELVEVCVVSDLLAHDGAHPVEPRLVDTGDAAASVAYQVLEFSAAGQGVEAGAVAEVDVAHHAQLLQAFQVAVDRCRLEPLRAAVASARDVLGRYRAVGREERLEDQPSWQREAAAALCETRPRRRRCP
jgi:hypothetical protein